MYIVKNTPIYSNKKLYRVGEKFPYSDKEKHLLWNLTLVEDKISKVEVSEIQETPKAQPTDKTVIRAIPKIKK